MQTDKRAQAQAFIEKVVAPARAAQSSDDPESVRARSRLFREDVELAKRELAAGGLDPERLDKLAAERSKSRKKLAAESHRKAIDASAAAAGRLADRLVHIVPIEPLDTVIDQVTFIRSFAGQGAVIESNIGPSDNWAKYRLEGGDDAYDGIGRLSFFTLWQNKQNSATVIMARPNLVINARLSCDAEWNGVASWFGFSSEARATVRARTTVWSMDSSVSSIVHDEPVGGAGVSGDFFGDDSSDSIEFNEVLPASGVAVPAQAYVLIEVELLTEWHANFGSVVLDANDGSRRVDLPQLLLTEIRSPEPPPISLTIGVDYATSPATATLIWSGANGATVDIYRNGNLLSSRQNDGITTVVLNPGSYVFRVCEAGSAVCSNDVTVTVSQ